MPLPGGPLLSAHNLGLSIVLILGFAVGNLLGTEVQLLLLGATTMALALKPAHRSPGTELGRNAGSGPDRNRFHLLNRNLSRIQRNKAERRNGPFDRELYRCRYSVERTSTG